MGSWPLVEAFEKSVASLESWLAAPGLPSDVAVCAAACRFVAICWVTFAYSVGLDCCNCWRLLSSWASGESWVLSGCCPIEDGALIVVWLVLGLLVLEAF